MRNKQAKRKIIIQPDTLYKSLLVQRIINQIQKDGKKMLAQRLVYKTMELLKSQTKSDPLEYLQVAFENVRPDMEVRSRRVGGATYQVPMPVRPERRETLAIRWIIKAAKERPNKTYHTFSDKLAAEVIDAHENQGTAIKKKIDTHKMAESNKAFSHFRW